MKYLHRICMTILAMLICSTVAFSEVKNPKREFRGAWIQAVNGQFLGMGEKDMKVYLTTMLNDLKKANVNAIIFQVRVEGDALYKSPYEPWSRYLTGTQGKNPGWDPLEFMVKEAHARSMELHAWINPYRVTASEKDLDTQTDQSIAKKYLSINKASMIIGITQGM